MKVIEKKRKEISLCLGKYYRLDLEKGNSKILFCVWCEKHIQKKAG